ncbi:MAG: hypothetical protein HQK79_20210 [Desulfobacterales bacterium]|nr:hypothetical protein [Desulfobacterales bacterium]
MGETIKCKFNIFKEGRKYTGHHRNYILESAIKVCYDPKTREGIGLREKLGFLGHGRRQIAKKLALTEVETVKLPDGTTIITENIPSNVTTYFEISKDGVVEHHQEILSTNPGKIVSALNSSQVGGWSWACDGYDGGAFGLTNVTAFEGFDYVYNPGFVENKGYILESADDKTKDLILENICKTGFTDNQAESYMKSWLASVQFKAMDLEEKLEQAAIFESTLKEQLEEKENNLSQINALIEQDKKAKENKKRLIMESASKSVIAIPKRVIDSLISMADEKDFGEIIQFFESASRVNLKTLPIGDNNNQRLEIPDKRRQTNYNHVEYGSAMAGAFDDIPFFV